MNTKELQKAVGTAPDGIIGPKTLAAVRAAGFDVVLDPGHTADHAREWPSAWPRGAWETPRGKRIMRALGITPDVHDSLEHIINVLTANAAAKYLQADGLKVLLYDDPAAANTAELTTAWKLANAARPRVFVSIHHNASRGVDTWEKNAPCGGVAFYRRGRYNGQQLARRLGGELRALRFYTQGQDDRADVYVGTADYGVLNHAEESIAAALVEVGFYDNANDLLWCAEHIDSIGAALARGITEYLKGGA